MAVPPLSMDCDYNIMLAFKFMGGTGMKLFYSMNF